MKRPSKHKSTSSKGNQKPTLKQNRSSPNAAASSPASSAFAASPTKALQKSASTIRTAISTPKKLASQLNKSEVKQASTKIAVSAIQKPVKQPSLSQPAKSVSVKPRAEKKAILNEGVNKNDACSPSPEPVRSSEAGSGRSFVPWKARGDLPCKR